MRVVIEGVTEENMLKVEKLLRQIPDDLHITKFDRHVDLDDYGIGFNLNDIMVTAVMGEYFTLIYKHLSLSLERKDIYEIRYF